jgi:Cft2 family RNA processing exonuclease
METTDTKKLAKYKVLPTEDGLHLDGSILWFDSHLNGELSFLSSAAHFQPTKVPQVIATEETIKILELKKGRTNALICQYNRPFSIGRLKIELLPSGCVLGGASLYVETDRCRVLYAPFLQTHKIGTVRQMQLKKAHTLILGAYHPDPNVSLPNRKKEKDRLLETVENFVKAEQFPVVLCKPVATAQELTKLFTDANLPIAVHSSIHRVNQVYEAYGSQLGNYTLYSPKHTKKKTLLFPLQEKDRNNLRRPIPEGPVLYVEETVAPSYDPNTFREVNDRFFISSTCDGKELKEVISAVSPKEVFVFGPYAKKYCEELKTVCKEIRPLYSNDQPTLF